MKKTRKPKVDPRRAYFASLAMQAIIAKHPATKTPDDGMGESNLEVARGAINYADALIAILDGYES